MNGEFTTEHIGPPDSEVLSPAKYPEPLVYMDDPTVVWAAPETHGVSLQAPEDGDDHGTLRIWVEDRVVTLSVDKDTIERAYLALVGAFPHRVECA